jgi:hypothetical protein
LSIQIERHENDFTLSIIDRSNTYQSETTDGVKAKIGFPGMKYDEEFDLQSGRTRDGVFSGVKVSGKVMRNGLSDVIKYVYIE